METTNSSEYIQYVYNYQRNKTTVNQELAEDLSVDWQKIINQKIDQLDKDNISKKDIENIRKITLEFYKKKNIPIYFIEKNKEELEEVLEDDKKLFKIEDLKTIFKILKGHRYNFNGIILEESKPGKKTLTRHLEGIDIRLETMKNSLINGIIFYEKFFPKLEIKDIKSGSWLWNKRVLEIESEINNNAININQKNKKQNSRQDNIDRMEKELKIKSGGEGEGEKNDKFLRIPIIYKDKKELIMKKDGEKLYKIITFLEKKGINSQNYKYINLKKLNKERENTQRSSGERKEISQINATLIARYLINKPIPDQKYLIPIEKIKETEKELYQKKVEEFKNLIKSPENLEKRKKFIE